MSNIERLAEAICTHEEEHKFRLGQVQGFGYGYDRVVRDCWLEPGQQEVWRKPESDRSHDEMMLFIETYRKKLSLTAALKACGLEVVKSGAVERAFREGHGCGVLTESPSATAPQMVKKANRDWPYSMAKVEAGGQDGA